ncbi:hypothetical protein Pfo_005236 [Paulownia fortunei]|nr:hypothetical protein Pfo_005236 [Paulownia fortunei]
MAGVRSSTWRSPLHMLPRSNRRVHGFDCCSTAPNGKSTVTQTPQLLKIAVSGVTELLRLFSPAGRERTVLVDKEWKDELSVSNVNDVLSIIRSDYEKAYFVTGKELYARNLRLLLPFFDNPSIQLKKLEKGLDSGTEFIVASWELRTYLKLPWKPLISIDGRTIYDLDEEFRIVRHAERWSMSALEAIIQIFTPSSGRPDQ